MPTRARLVLERTLRTLALLGVATALWLASRPAGATRSAPSVLQWTAGELADSNAAAMTTALFRELLAAGEDPPREDTPREATPRDVTVEPGGGRGRCLGLRTGPMSRCAGETRRAQLDWRCQPRLWPVHPERSMCVWRGLARSPGQPTAPRFRCCWVMREACSIPSRVCR